MRKLLILSSAFLLAPLLALPAAADKPNIVFILADDMAYNKIGCYGNHEVITPNIDRLAAEGLRFNDHYDTTSICMASRCCIMTGLYEYRHGCNFDHGKLEPKFMDQSYPVLLRKAGYFTGFAGKIGFELEGQSFEALAPYFDKWAGGPQQTRYETAKNPGIAKYAAQYPHCSRAYGAWGVDFLKAAKASGKPFCMSISFKAPHMPFDPDPIDMKLYPAKTYSRVPNYGRQYASYLSAQSKTSRAYHGYPFWISNYDPTIAKYYALITGLDFAVGMIRQKLEAEGFASNTVIIVTSDNGYNCGSHGFGDKVLPYEEASRAPLIIYDPRQPKSHAGVVTEALTANIDIAPTICALAGVPAPEGIDGKSLVPVIADPQAQVREALPLFNFWGAATAQSMAVVTHDWKYIYWYSGGKGMNPTEELFHVSADRFELSLTKNAPEKLMEMRKLYDSQLALLKAKDIQIHGYAPYPVLFDRNIPWDQKVPLLKNVKSAGGEGEEDKGGGGQNGGGRKKKSSE